MTETLCTCTDQNCTAGHDIETAEQATYVFWFKGEYHETLAFADSLDEAIAEIRSFVADAPEDIPGWIIKNRATGRKQTADKLLAQCAA